MASPRLFLHRSNRVEVLADALAELLAGPGADPFDPEWIVVQGRGMSVWLAQELSRRLGVWAGESFVYPRNFVARAFEVVLGLGPEGLSERHGRDALVFGVLAALERHRNEPALSPLASYLAADPVEGPGAAARAHQLAQRIADVFDQYLTYRPDVLRRWSAGDEAALEEADRWQPSLWRALEAGLGESHIASLERVFLERLLGSETPLAGLPPRIVVFGLSSVPPLYVRVLGALASRCEVHWYLPAPATGYWADVASARTIARAEGRGISPADLHLDAGHPLLASLGKLGADLEDVIVSELEALGVDLDERDLFVPPSGDSMLEGLQRDILHIAPSPGDRPFDPSISLFACHGPMREVEVLQDQLLALLSDHPNLAPRDIVVMMPDVEAYAPLVEAVFDLPPDDPRFIPFRIADRSLRRDSPVLDAFERILALAGGRARASEIVDLFALDPLRQRFDIEPAELDIIRNWVSDSGIRWGIDAAHRNRHGQANEHRNTWRFGLERLLLGHALPGRGRILFADTLPYDEIEGSTADLLGKLALASERLFSAMETLEMARPLAEWQPVLLSILEDSLAEDDDNAWEHQRIRDGIEEMVRASRIAAYEGVMGIEAVRALLDIHVEAGEPARGFLAGGITFCAMVPMRSIPFAVVCLIGMNDGAFPRASSRSSFDLIARAPKKGDRSRRDDDRYLFLEALLSARLRFMVSYRGHSPRDDALLPPAPVVGELLDVLAERHLASLPRQARRLRARAELVIDHPLSPYSPRYFAASEPRLFSHAEAHLRAARILGGERRERPFFDAPLPDEPLTTVELGELIGFFENPIRHLFESRLGVSLRNDRLSLPDREPIELEGLDRHAIGERLLDLRLDGVATEDLVPLMEASGMLPYGAAGRCDHAAVLAVVAPLAERVLRLRGAGRERDLPLETALPSGVVLRGALSDRFEAGLVRHQYAQVSGKQLLSLWIRHLAYSAIDGEARSHLVGRAQELLGTKKAGSASPVHTYRFTSLAPTLAKARLDDLVSLYRIGRSEPLLLFPKSGFVQARSGNTEIATNTTRVFEDHDRRFDPHVSRLFSDASILSPEAQPFGMERRGPAFGELSERVFGPLCAALEIEP